MAHKQREERILHDAEEFRIRKATPAQRDELRKLFEEHIDKNWWPLPDRALTIAAIDKKTGKLIGGIERDINNIKEHYASGAGLVVLPDFRDKGIGTALAKTMDKELEAMGVTRVSIVVASDDAWKIYRKEGYEYDAKTKAYLKEKGLPEDRFVEKLPMTKELGREPAREVFHVEVSREGFEKAAQDIGGVKKQIGMLVTLGFHADEKQFTEDVARYIQKARGERDITVHELKPAIKSLDMISEKYDKTGKGYSYRKQMSLQRKGHFQVLRDLTEMRKVAEKEKADVVIDLHYASIQHDPKFFMLYSASNPAPKTMGLENNAPLTWGLAYTKESFDEYSKIPGINVLSFCPDNYSVGAPEPIRRIDRLRAFLDSGYRLDQSPVETAKEKLAGYSPVTIEGFVLHEPHKQGEKCEMSRELYEKVVAATGDAVIRIYDHFNSKLLKKEPAKGGVETSVGIVKLREESSVREIGRSFEVILKPSDSSEERKIGTVGAIFEKIGGIEEFQARYALIKNGLREDDRIANISSFAPFWELTKELAPDVEKSIQERFMRKRIGTAAMGLLLDELKSERIIGVYCQTGVKEMRGLLKKFEFQEICETAYFKKL
jgi:GNAT superfamily N-acetyltransferase